MENIEKEKIVADHLLDEDAENVYNDLISDVGQIKLLYVTPEFRSCKTGVL